MITNREPFIGITSVPDLYNKIMSSKYPLPKDVDHNISDVISKMLELDPNRRITIEELSTHDLFNMYKTYIAPLIFDETSVNIGKITEKSQGDTSIVSDVPHIIFHVYGPRTKQVFVVGLADLTEHTEGIAFIERSHAKEYIQILDKSKTTSQFIFSDYVQLYE